MWIYLKPPQGPNEDVRIEAAMSQIKPIVEYYSDNGSYKDINCSHSEEMTMICDDVKKFAGVEPTFHTTSDKYCAYVKLTDLYDDGFLETTYFKVKKVKEQFFCVDSQGNSQRTIINPSSYCNDNNFTCPPAGY